MATPIPATMKPRRAVLMGVVCLVLLVGLLWEATRAAAGPGSVALATTASAEQSLPAMLVAQQAHLVAADGVHDANFGGSVAIDGDTAVIGAINDTVGTNGTTGSVYVFTRTGTTWSQQAKLVLPAGSDSEGFGGSVAISGDTVVVGASEPFATQGSAYVFVRSGTTWTQQAKLTASDGTGSITFAWKVAISGDTIIVGGSQDGVGANDGQGSAYVFTRSGTTWSQQARLTATDGAANDQFGSAVALSGDTAIVGAPMKTFGVQWQGSAYVFTRVGTTWTQQAELIAPDPVWDARFGLSVALSGDTAIVGSWYGAVNSTSVPGAAYVFTRSGTSWNQQAKLRASDRQGPDDFGCSLSLQGDSLLVGADRYEIGTHEGQGAGYVFTRTGKTWSQRVKLVAADGSALDGFGHSVELSGDTAVIGAYWDTAGGIPFRGSAYVFKLKDPSKPSIASVYPTHAVPMGAVVVGGSLFGTTQGIGTVACGGIPVAVTNWSDTTIYCSVPAALAPGRADVVVTTSRGASYAQPFTVDATVPGQPVISSITPPHALRGTSVTIAGLSFGAGQNASTVTFGGIPAAVTSWSDAAIACRAPTGATVGAVDVVVHTALDSNATRFTVDAKPSISKLSATRGRVGVTLTISGRYFGTTRGASKVLFAFKPATKYLSWSATRIKVRVPTMTKGRKAIRVVTTIGKSNVKYFTLL